MLLDILQAILDDQKADDESSLSLDSVDNEECDDLSEDVSSFNSNEKRELQLLHEWKRPTESIEIQSFASQESWESRKMHGMQPHKYLELDDDETNVKDKHMKKDQFKELRKPTSQDNVPDVLKQKPAKEILAYFKR